MQRTSIYELTNNVTGDRYIGVAVDIARRLRAHRNSARNTSSKTHIHNAMRKYGVDNFTLKVRAELPSIEEAKLAERILIAVERPRYNMTGGGDGGWGRHWTQQQFQNARRGWNHREESKRKIGEANKGRAVSEETRAKLRLARSRRVTTDETRQKMSAAAQRRRQQATETQKAVSK